MILDSTFNFKCKSLLLRTLISFKLRLVTVYNRRINTVFLNKLSANCPILSNLSIRSYFLMENCVFIFFSCWLRTYSHTFIHLLLNLNFWPSATCFWTSQSACICCASDLKKRRRKHHFKDSCTSINQWNKANLTFWATALCPVPTSRYFFGGRDEGSCKESRSLN